MADDPVLLHVGYAKTATTTLQRLVFPRVGTLIRRRDPAFRTAADHLVESPDSEYRADEVRAVLERFLDGANHPVISDEVLSGTVWIEPTDAVRTADRLRELLPDARVLICVRSQATALMSLYGTFVKKGGYVSFSRFLADGVPRRHVHLDHLRFDALVERYHDLYGRDRVVVLPYELLVREPALFLERVATMVDPDGGPVSLDGFDAQNRSLSAGWQLALRTANRLVRRTHYNPKPPLGTSRANHVRDPIERCDARVALGARGRVPRRSRRRLARLLADLAASNARLAACTGLDLGAYGYPLPAG